MDIKIEDKDQSGRGQQQDFPALGQGRNRESKTPLLSRPAPRAGSGQQKAKNPVGEVVQKKSGAPEDVFAADRAVQRSDAPKTTDSRMRLGFCNTLTHPFSL